MITLLLAIALQLQPHPYWDSSEGGFVAYERTERVGDRTVRSAILTDYVGGRPSKVVIDIRKETVNGQVSEWNHIADRNGDGLLDWTIVSQDTGHGNAYIDLYHGGAGANILAKRAKDIPASEYGVWTHRTQWLDSGDSQVAPHASDIRTVLEHGQKLITATLARQPLAELEESVNAAANWRVPMTFAILNSSPKMHPERSASRPKAKVRSAAKQGRRHH